MANFVKKMLVRTKSRSKSPVKHTNNEFQHWSHTVENGHYQMPYFPCHYPRNTLEDNAYGYYGNQSGTSSALRAPLAVAESLTPHYPYSKPSPANSTPSFEYSHPPEAIWNTMTSRASQTSIGSHHSERRLPGRTNEFRDVVDNQNILDAREPHPQIPNHHSSSAFDRPSHTPDRSDRTSSTLNRQDMLNRTSDRSPLTLDAHRTPEGSRRTNYGTVDSAHLSRPRSSSPIKASRATVDGSEKKSRSKSPRKGTNSQVIATLDYLSPQCQSEGCCASILVQDTRFLVCKHQLSHASEYFRSMFLANRSIPVSGASQSSLNEFAIVVSSFLHPPPAIQFKWFLECAIQAPVLKDITDDTLETCMRLSKRFRAQGLEMRCAKYIQENVSKKAPMVALCWLNWVLKHKFDKASHDACLPSVARASLTSLEEHRNMITERLLADLLAAKLRTLYDQAVNVFQTIHEMDHFFVDLERCPRCGRQREQGRVRVYASPCRKLLGCERCMRDNGCEIAAKDTRDLQAFYRCEHGLTALNDRIPDCQCQLTTLTRYIARTDSMHTPLADGPNS